MNIWKEKMVRAKAAAVLLFAVCVYFYPRLGYGQPQDVNAVLEAPAAVIEEIAPPLQEEAVETPQVPAQPPESEAQLPIIEDVGVSSPKIQTKMVTPRYAPADQLRPLLEQIKSESGKIIYNEATNTFTLIDTPGELKAMEDLIRQMDVPVETKTFELRYIKAQQAAQDLRDILTEYAGRVEFPGGEDTIVVTDTPAKLEEAAKLIDALDKPQKEILLEIKTLQIILNDEHREGIDWEAIVSDFQTMPFEGFREDPQGRLSLGTLTDEDYAVLLDALDTVGFINTVANVKVTTADQKQSEITIQASELLSAYEREGKNSGILEENDIRYQITPKLSAEDKFSMRIIPQVASQEAASGEGIALDISTGTTIVIGGLFKKVTVESTRKIPLLGDLPLLGFAFRSHGERFRETEVIVFITPKAIVKE